MRLTKYQQSRLLEFEWDVIEDDVSNTRWLQLDTSDGETFERVKKILAKTGHHINDDTSQLKLLVIATRTD